MGKKPLHSTTDFSDCTRGKTVNSRVKYSEPEEQNMYSRDQSESNMNPIWIQNEPNMNPIWIQHESNMNPIWTQYEPNMYLTPPASMFKPKPWSCSHEPTLYWLDGLMHCSSATPHLLRRPLRFSWLIVVCCNWLSQNVKMLKMVCHVVDNAWAAAFF